MTTTCNISYDRARARVTRKLDLCKIISSSLKIWQLRLYGCICKSARLNSFKFIGCYLLNICKSNKLITLISYIQAFN